MRRSEFVEEVQLVAQAEPDVPRFEPVAILIGLAAMLVVLAIGLAFYLAKFQVDGQIITSAFWIVAIVSIASILRIRPASKLPPVERMIRSKRNAYGLLGLLTGAAIVGAVMTATALKTTEDWIMLAVIASSPIGWFFLINTRFGMA